MTTDMKLGDKVKGDIGSPDAHGYPGLGTPLAVLTRPLRAVIVASMLGLTKSRYD